MQGPKSEASTSSVEHLSLVRTIHESHEKFEALLLINSMQFQGMFVAAIDVDSHRRLVAMSVGETLVIACCKR